MSKMYCQITMATDEILCDKNARVVMGLNYSIVKDSSADLTVGN